MWRMRKVEFLLIFILLVLFQLALFFITPTKQYDSFVTSVHHSIELAKYTSCKSKALTVNVYYSYFQLIVELEAPFINFIELIS